MFHDPLPNIYKVFSILIQQERQNNCGSNYGGGRGTKICSFYNKPRHIVACISKQMVYLHIYTNRRMLCFSKNQFHTPKQINTVYIKLLNRSNITTNFDGTIMFSSNIYLFNVLFILEFTCSLIYVPRLSVFIVILIKIFLIYKTIIFRMMIGTTKLHSGIYLITFLSVHTSIPGHYQTVLIIVVLIIRFINYVYVDSHT